MARASARPRPGKRPWPRLAALTAVRTSPRSSLPTRAKGRSSSNGAVLLAALSRFRRSIGRCGRKIETKRLMTELHDKAPPRGLAPAALKRELPGRCAGCIGVEGGFSTAPCRDAPAGEGAGEARLLMAREKQARRARGLRGKAETAGGERRLDLGLRQGRPNTRLFSPSSRAQAASSTVLASTMRKSAGSRPKARKPGP